MPKRIRTMSADAAASQEAPETVSSGAARMMPKRKRTASKSVKAVATTVGPTASAIALSIPLRDFRTDAVASFELRWEGHWEVWEREWGTPVWIWD